MKGLLLIPSCSALVLMVGLLAACGSRARMEPCRFTEIEGAELEADAGDFDAERGEVEMACGDELVDVTWSQFRTRLGIDPG